jgi:hypothetical protein
MSNSAIGIQVASLTQAQRAILEARLQNRRLALRPTRIAHLAGNRRAFALSFAQQRLWFLHSLSPQSDAYNIPVAVCAQGRLNVAVLEQSLGEIRRRHAVLRTVFTATEGQPAQRVLAPEHLNVSLVDMSALSAAEQDSLARHLAAEEATRPFNLEEEVPFRSALLLRNDDQRIILFTMHHIASDSWSMGVLTRELTSLYETLAGGVSSPLPELEIQYADYAEWHNHWLQGRELNDQLQYWTRQLKGAPPALLLPSDRPRPPVQTFNGANRRLLLPLPLYEHLVRLRCPAGCTLFMKLLAALDILLYFYTGQHDIVVGTDAANRSRVQTEDLIGFFVNQLVLRTDLCGDPSYEELLGRVRETALSAYAHQDLPFQKLVEVLRPERSPRYSPLFQIKFILNGAPAGALSLQRLSLTQFSVETRTAQLDLTIPLWEAPDGIGGWINYNTDIFDAASIVRFAWLYEMLVGFIVARPTATLSELVEMLIEADGEQQVKREEECNRASRQKLRVARRRPVQWTQ